MKKHTGINLSVRQHQLWWTADGQVAAFRLDGSPYNYHQPVALRSEWWAAIEAATNAIGQETLKKPRDTQRLGLLQDWVREAERIVKAFPGPEPVVRVVERWQPTPIVTSEERKLAAEVDHPKYGGLGMKSRRAKAWRKRWLKP